MSQYSTLITAINANIRQNGQQEITGQILNSILREMVAELGVGYQYMGVASPAIVPDFGDSKQVYLALQAGIYTHFGDIEVEEGEIALLMYADIWEKVTLQDLGVKLERVELACLDSVSPITYKGQTEALTFAQVKALVDDRTKFVTLLFGEMYYLIPSVDFFDDAVEFAAVNISNELVEANRVVINSQNEVSAYAMGVESSGYKAQDINRNIFDVAKQYPSVAAMLKLQSELQRIYSDFAEYDKTAFPDINFGTPIRSGAYIGADGSFIADAGYNVSNEIAVTRGTLYKLFVGADTIIPSGIAVFAKKVITHTSAGDVVSYQPQFVSAGGATPKAGYLVFLATEDMTIVVSYPTTISKLVVVRYGVLVSLCTQIDLLRKAVDLKSFADGYYANMRVGLADNLAPKGEVTAELIPELRKSGGDKSILDGNAVVKKLKGNSVVWNQLVPNELSEGNDKGVSFRRNGSCSLHIEGTTTSASAITVTYSQSPIIAGHKYLYLIVTNGTIGTFNSYIDTGGSMAWIARNQISVAPSDGVASFLIYISAAGDSVNFDAVFQLYDLTQMFGVGNEPASYEGFLRRKPQGIDEYAYNEGTIINNATKAILTKNEDATEESTRELPIITEKFPEGFKSAGSASDEIEILADKTIVRKKIGIKVFDGSEDWNFHVDTESNLPVHWIIIQGKRNVVQNEAVHIIANGYTTDSIVHHPSLSNKDKCVYETYVWESNVVFVDSSYANTDAWKAHLAELYAQGNPLTVYYELADTIVEELPTINAEFQVWGNGTEGSVAEGASTPLSADVVYGLDAYSTIKENKAAIGILANLQTTTKTDLVSAINELVQRVAALEAK